MRESNRQLVAVAKGLAGALLVVGVSLLIGKSQETQLSGYAMLSGKYHASQHNFLEKQQRK